MSFLQVITLAMVQGLTEFLPVSSSGHLVLLQQFFGLSEPPILFDTVLHLGTLLAVLVFFKDKILDLVSGVARAFVEQDPSKIPVLVWAVGLGSFPAVLAGLLLNSFLNSLFSSLELLTFSFLVTSLLLFSLRFVKLENNLAGEVNLKKSLVIGLFQALALLPGVSRSGTTIVSAQWLGVKKEQAFEFSFLLSIPAILGAVLLEFTKIKVVFSASLLLTYLLGIILSGLVGWLSLKALQKLLVAECLYLFGFYTLSLAVLSLVVSYF